MQKSVKTEMRNEAKDMNKYKIIVVGCIMCLLITGCEVNTNKSVQADILRPQERKKEMLNINQEALMGIWIDRVYKSVPAGITYVLAEDCVKKEDDEIKALMDIDSEIAFGEEEFLKELVKKPTIIGAIIQDNSTGDSIVICYENLTLQGIEKMKEEDYVKVIENKIRRTEGDNYVIEPSATAIINEKTYRVLPITITGTSTKKTHYLRKVGTYMVDIMVTSLSGDESNLMRGF